MAAVHLAEQDHPYWQVTLEVIRTEAYSAREWRCLHLERVA